VELDSGIYLRTFSIRAFTLLDYLTHSLTRSTERYVHYVSISLPHREVPAPQEGQADNCIRLCCTAACSFQFQPKSLGITQHSAPLNSLISRIIPHCHYLSSSQDIQDLHFRLSFSFQDHFLGPLLLKAIFLSRNPNPGLACLNSVCAHA